MSLISVGIDVSKGKSTVCIMKPGGEVLEPPFEVIHTAECIAALAQLINAYDEECCVILEETGHYHWPIAVTLVESGVFVCAVNALRMKKYCSQSIRKAKNNRIDSIRIASFGLTYWSELVTFKPAQEAYGELRILSRQCYTTLSMLVAAKVNLSNLIDRVMPDIQSHMRDNPCNNRRTDFVERYWHYEQILQMGEKNFTTDFCKWAKKQGYRSYEHLASRLFAAAQNGIPVLPHRPLAGFSGKDVPKGLHKRKRPFDHDTKKSQALSTW